MKVRGISISGGQGQKAGAFQSAAASSSSSSTSEPPAKPSAKEVFAKAVEDFTGADARELTFKKGDILKILSQDDSGTIMHAHTPDNAITCVLSFSFQCCVVLSLQVGGRPN